MVIQTLYRHNEINNTKCHVATTQITISGIIGTTAQLHWEISTEWYNHQQSFWIPQP
jgi:argonaute-like protein implicated in RNA metabolism and viral defense